MESKLLRDLEATARTTGDTITWARSMCRTAEQYARQGETAEALSSITAVRSRFGKEMAPEVAAWVMLTEGILKYYSGETDLGIDRLLRAHAVAAASPNCVARPTCAAWLALYYLNTRRFDEMIASLREALQLATIDDHQARGRAALVVADAFHLGGRFDLARPWYEMARQHATKEGDASAISAILHNVTAFRACNVKLADALGTHLPDEAQRATMEANSAAAYDRAVGTRSLASYLPHVTAQILIVEGKYKDAMLALSSIDVESLPRRAHAVHYVDLATCALNLGDRPLLGRAVAFAEESLKQATDADDVIYACCRLASIHEAAGDEGRVAQFRTRASAETDAYRSVQDQLVSKLARMTDEVRSRYAYQ